MKKLLAACVCAGLSFSIAGCSPGTVLEQFTSTGDTSVRELTSSSDTTTTTEAKDRVYMDELSGRHLTGFFRKSAHPEYRQCLLCI